MLARDRRIHLRKVLKKARQVTSGNANPGIDHLAGIKAPTFTRRHAHCDAAGLGEFDRIAQQIEQHLAHPVRIRLDGYALHRQVGHDLDTHLQVFALGKRLNRGSRLVHHCNQRNRLDMQSHLARFDLGEIENFVNHAQQMLGRSIHPRQAFLNVSRPGRKLGVGCAFAHFLGHHVRQADDRIQGRAQFMAHVGEKFAFGT